jgi:hypothetical protein
MHCLDPHSIKNQVRAHFTLATSSNTPRRNSSTFGTTVQKVDGCQRWFLRFLRLYLYFKSNSCILNNCIQKFYLNCWIICVIIICDAPEDEPVIGLKHVGL